MSDKDTPPADETAPIAGRRPASGSTPGNPSAPQPPGPASTEPPPAAAYDAPPADATAAATADGPPGASAKRSWRERLRRGTATGGSRTFGVGALIAGTL